MKQAQECNDDVGYFLGRGNNWATSEGMVFKASGKYSNSACTGEVVLPFNETMPFLSEKGKRAIRAFRK